MRSERLALIGLGRDPFRSRKSFTTFGEPHSECFGIEAAKDPDRRLRATAPLGILLKATTLIMHLQGVVWLLLSWGLSVRHSFRYYANTLSNRIDQANNLRFSAAVGLRSLAVER